MSVEQPVGAVVHALSFLHAVRESDTARALALLSDHPDISGMSIRTAAAAGDLEAVQRLLAAHPSCATQAIPPDFTPPLVYAVMSDVKRARDVSIETQVALVRALLDAGASPNSAVPLPMDEGEIPALYFPSVTGNAPVVQLLLERGANPTDGESLHHAAQHDQREVLSLLRQFGADLSRGPEGRGTSPLYFLASHRAGSRLDRSVIGGMTWLLAHGADPNVPLDQVGDGQQQAQRGERPLHRLAASGYGAELIEQFIAHGAAIDPRRADGLTPYQVALRAGQRAAADVLERAGADRSLAGPGDWFLAACLTADAEAATRLLEQHPTLIEELDAEARGAIAPAIADGREEAVQLMVTLGWPLDTESAWGGTALHWAAWHGRAAIVTLLLRHGAAVNHRDHRYGSSPIAWAAHGSRFSENPGTAAYPSVIRLLLDAGATRDASINRWGEPPEALATDDVRQLLIDAGFVS